MGHALALGRCCICKEAVSFNPITAPSIRVGDSKKPICRMCMKRANHIREEKGLPSHPIRKDAYGPCDEAEIP